MSGIFGVMYRHTDEKQLTDAIGGLEYWTRMYGRADYAVERIPNGAIGCHIEHFSDSFPYGGPILRFNGCPAVVDALLYNREELTAELKLDADVLLSDEELLLRWIDVMGPEALVRVNGDFAGAVFDPRTGEWFLFRDHLGVRPLYLYLDDDLFAFSTDMVALASLPNADLQVNKHFLFVEMIHSNYVTLQETEFQRITCARPGAVTTVAMNEQTYTKVEKPYFQLRQKRYKFKTDAEYQQELRRLVTDSVNRRCDAIPGLLGAELSGGLDSSVISILIKRHGREARYYSWSLDPSENPILSEDDERKIIMEICDREQIECRFRMAQDEVRFNQINRPLPPPYVDTIYLSYGSQWVKSEGASVMFTGHSGDEGVSHRTNPFELFYNGEYLAYLRIYWAFTRGKNLRLLRTARSLLRDTVYHVKNLRVPYPAERINSPIFQPAYREEMLRTYKPQRHNFMIDPHQYVVQGGSRPRMDIGAYWGAMNGVRYLYPYLDYRVIDFALSIPRRLYLTHDNNRVIFREAFRDLMPESLHKLNRKFSVSAKNVQKAEDRANFLESVLNHLLSQLDRAQWEELFDFDAISRITLPSKEHAADFENATMRLVILGKCISVQKIQRNAKNWREFDEQDKNV